VTSIATDTADNVGSEVLLLRAVIFTMSDLPAVLTCLVLVVTQGTVEGGQLTKLVALEFVLTLGDRSSLGHGQDSRLMEKASIVELLSHRFNDVVDEFLGLVDLLLGVGHDETVQVLLLVARVSSIGASFAFLDGTLAANGNLGSRLRLHLLQCVTTRSNE
jgi:hypothetical protein